MKKFAKTLIVCAITIIIIISTVSCSPTPELSFNKANQQLKDLDYNVTITRDDLDFGKTTEFRAKNGDDFLYMTEYIDEKTAKINYKHLELQMNAQIEDLKMRIELLEFYIDEYDYIPSDQSSEYHEEIQDLKYELKQNETVLFGIDGNIVWCGTERAIEESNE